MVLQASSNFQGRKYFPGLNGTIYSWKHIILLTCVSFSLTWLDIPFAFGGLCTQRLLPFPLRLETRILLQWFMFNRPRRDLGSHLVHLRVCILYAVPLRKDSSTSSFWGFCKPYPPDPYPGTSVSWEIAAKISSFLLYLLPSTGCLCYSPLSGRLPDQRSCREDDPCIMW